MTGLSFFIITMTVLGFPELFISAQIRYAFLFFLTQTYFFASPPNLLCPEWPHAIQSWQSRSEMLFEVPWRWYIWKFNHADQELLYIHNMGILWFGGETLPSLIYDSSFGPTILGIKHGIEADFKQSGFQPLFTGKPFNHNMQRSPVQSGKSNCSLNTNCSSLSPATNNRCQ